MAIDIAVFVYAFADYQLIDKIATAYNPAGILAISSGHTARVLACPDEKAGHVRIQFYGKSLVDERKSNVFRTNKKVIVCLALNYEGSLLATASKKGTVVRVYNSHTTELLQELRRGAKEAEVTQLMFHRSSQFLCCSSNKQTLHIFELFDAVKSIDPSQCKGYLDVSPKDEIGYSHDEIRLAPGTKNKTSKYGIEKIRVESPRWGRSFLAISIRNGVWPRPSTTFLRSSALSLKRTSLWVSPTQMTFSRLALREIPTI